MPGISIQLPLNLQPGYGQLLKCGVWSGLSCLVLVEVEDLLPPATLNLVPATARGTWEAILFTAAWAIWRARNRFVMENKRWCLLQIISEIQIFAHLWLSSGKVKFTRPWSTWVLKPGDACTYVSLPAAAAGVSYLVYVLVHARLSSQCTLGNLFFRRLKCFANNYLACPQSTPRYLTRKGGKFVHQQKFLCLISSYSTKIFTSKMHLPAYKE